MIFSEKTPPKVQTHFFSLLLPLINEPDQVSTKVLDVLFSRIIEPAKSNNKESLSLAVNLLKRGNTHFEYLAQNVSNFHTAYFLSLSQYFQQGFLKKNDLKT